MEKNMEVKEIFTYSSIKKIVLEWNSQLSEASSRWGSADIIYCIWCISL